LTEIAVDRKLCTFCGICSDICAMGIITPADKDADRLPSFSEERAGFCIKCGHCEAFCPSGALLLNFRPDEKIMLSEGAGDISTREIARYLQKRRSIRNFSADPVSRDRILQILDIARYAASGGNGQPVQWLIVHDSEKVKRIAALTIEWMKGLRNTNHPMSGYVPVLISAWEEGRDMICRGAPHLLFAHIPENNPVASIDAIIALTHFDVAAPAFGVGTCWAGFVAMAATFFEPLKKELGLPDGQKIAYAMMFGHPKYKIHAIPRRNPLHVKWL